MIAKLALRRLPNGDYYVQGVIPARGSNLLDLPEFADAVASAEVTLVEVEDREREYQGLSNETIKAKGFP